MFKNWRKYLGGWNPDFPRPELEPGEWLIVEGRADFNKGFFGGVGGPIILTNRRFIWYDDALSPLWPFKRASGQIPLVEIASADKGTLLDWVGGGKRLRLSLRNGRSKCVFAPDGLDEWITAINTAVAMYGSDSYQHPSSR